MRNLCIKLYTDVYCAVVAFKQEEHGAVDVVAVVVLIGIAVALALIFKKRIKTLSATLLGSSAGNAKEAVR